MTGFGRVACVVYVSLPIYASRQLNGPDQSPTTLAQSTDDPVSKSGVSSMTVDIDTIRYYDTVAHC